MQVLYMWYGMKNKDLMGISVIFNTKVQYLDCNNNIKYKIYPWVILYYMIFYYIFAHFCIFAEGRCREHPEYPS